MRVKQLEAAAVMLGVIRTKLQYSCCPVSELVEELASREDIAVLRFIRPCAEACRSGKDFPVAWREALGERENISNFKADDVKKLTAFGETLGTTAIEGQLASCDMYTALLEESLACARNDMKKYSKLFPALGVLFGIAVLVVAA